MDRGAESLVMDLRYNAGGVVSGAVDVAAMFLPAEVVVCRTRGRFREETTVRSYTTQAESPDQPADPPARKPVDLPIVVLVNAESASASEILAGALQDHGRALLVGERTYGKFVMQTLFPLLSREALVRFTTSRYETPKGRSAQRSERLGARGGLLPDLRVSLGGDDQRDRLARWFGQETDERIWRVMESDEPGTPPDDPQLRAAVDLLRGTPPPAESLVPGR
jgi:carboxyl-terminal processing protease